MQLSSSSLPLASAMSSLGSHVILSQTAFHIYDTYLLISVKKASVCEAVWLLFAVTHVCVSLSAFWQSIKHPLLYKLNSLVSLVSSLPVLSSCSCIRSATVVLSFYIERVYIEYS